MKEEIKMLTVLYVIVYTDKTGYRHLLDGRLDKQEAQDRADHYNKTMFDPVYTIEAIYFK